MNKELEIKTSDQRYLEVQALLHAMLSETDRICRHEGLAYALFFDTLWGAVCSRNFRAGSETAHIVLMREDYECLISALQQRRLNPRFLLELPGGAEHSIRPYARLCCRNTDVHRVPELPLHNDYFPVSLSILPLDHVAASAEVQAQRLQRILAWTEALRLKGQRVDSVNEVGRIGDGSIELRAQYDQNVVQTQLSRFEICFKSLWPRRLAIRRRAQLMRGKGSDSTERFAVYQPMSGLIPVVYFDKHQVFPVASIPLGKKAYSCPSKAHEVLTELYGNYRCDLCDGQAVHNYAAFTIDVNYWADIIYADDPSVVL